MPPSTIRISEMTGAIVVRKVAMFVAVVSRPIAINLIGKKEFLKEKVSALDSSGFENWFNR